MHLQVCFRHCDASPSLTDRIDRRARRLARRFDRDARFHVVCDVGAPGGSVEVQARVLGARFVARGHDPDPYAALERAFDKLQRWAARRHDRLTRRRRRRPPAHALAA